MNHGSPWQKGNKRPILRFPAKAPVFNVFYIFHSRKSSPCTLLRFITTPLIRSMRGAVEIQDHPPLLVAAQESLINNHFYGRKLTSSRLGRKRPCFRRGITITEPSKSESLLVEVEDRDFFARLTVVKTVGDRFTIIKVASGIWANRLAPTPQSFLAIQLQSRRTTEQVGRISSFSPKINFDYFAIPRTYIQRELQCRGISLFNNVPDMQKQRVHPRVRLMGKSYTPMVKTTFFAHITRFSCQIPIRFTGKTSKKQRSVVGIVPLIFRDHPNYIIHAMLNRPRRNSLLGKGEVLLYRAHRALLAQKPLFFRTV